MLLAASHSTWIVFQVRARVKARMKKSDIVVLPAPREARYLTHRDLVEVVAEESGWIPEKGQPEKSPHRSFRSYVKTWCTFCGKTLDSPAIETLGPDTAARLARLTDELENSKRHGAAGNVRWAVTEVQRVYESLRTTSALPTDFNEALKACMSAAGLKVTSLIRALNEQYPDTVWSNNSIYGYVTGKTHPSVRAKPIVLRLEQVLRLPEGTLMSRAFKGPKLIQMGNANPIKIRVHQSHLSKYPYSLKELPPNWAALWREISHWRSQQTLRVRGKLHVLKPGDYWEKPATLLKHEVDLRRFLGWLSLPAPTKPIFDMSDEERWQCGLGLKLEEITFAHLFDMDLVWDYFQFLRSRQCNHKLHRTHLGFLLAINSLANRPYSFLKAHDRFALLFGQSLKGTAWVDFVETNIHQPILTLSREMQKALTTDKQRDPNDPLKTVFAGEDPMQYLFEMTRRMEEENVPPATQMQARAGHLRNTALIKMCLEVPLRAQNLSELRLGQHLTRDATTGQWTVAVPKAELKNRNSKHARDIFRTYSLGVSLAIDRYLDKGRPQLRGASETNFFFLSRNSGYKRKGQVGELRYQYTVASIYQEVSAILRRYFGVSMGTNLFRHLLATSILKDDSSKVDTAAAVLNNSPVTIKRNYGHLTQNDGLRAADEWMAKQKAKFQKGLDRRDGASKG